MAGTAAAAAPGTQKDEPAPKVQRETPLRYLMVGEDQDLQAAGGFKPLLQTASNNTHTLSSKIIKQFEQLTPSKGIGNIANKFFKQGSREANSVGEDDHAGPRAQKGNSYMNIDRIVNMSRLEKLNRSYDDKKSKAVNLKVSGKVLQGFRKKDKLAVNRNGSTEMKRISINIQKEGKLLSRGLKHSL